MNLSDRLGDREAVIYYLGHSGWAVRTREHFLVFDYFESNKTTGDKTLECGYINPEEIKDQNVVVFVSHKHEDHYDKIIKSWKGTISNITYIAGWGSRGSDFIGVPPHTDTTVNNISISTLRSTDEGSGFLVNVDGLTIFHGGDHANWEDNDPEVSYFDEIDYIAAKASMVDIAFVPVTTFSGMRPKCMTEGALYAINKLKPKAAFPMHGNNREYLYREFAGEKEAKGLKIECADRPGDHFIYGNGAVVNKL